MRRFEIVDDLLSRRESEHESTQLDPFASDPPNGFLGANYGSAIKLLTRMSTFPFDLPRTLNTGRFRGAGNTPSSASPIQSHGKVGHCLSVLDGTGQPQIQKYTN